MTWQKYKIPVAMLSVVSNCSLVVLKILVGLLIGSISVISEAIHSGVDLLASFIALFAVKTSDKPADQEHPYGHGKIENLSGVIEAVLIFIAAAWIIFEAVRKLTTGTILLEPGWGIGVMFISALANAGVSRLLFKVGKETQSMALEADAWHLRTDVYTSAGVMVGLGLIWLGERIFPGLHFHWIDPMAAIAVALLIIKAAYDLTIRSTHDLMDVGLPADELAWIHECIKKATPPVTGFHHLRSRKSGAYRFVEFHLLFEGKLSVRKAHAISEEITQAIRDRYPGTSVTIHIEPHDDVEPDRTE